VDLHAIVSSWPGKSPPPGFDVCHPAAYHMLDVAAVAERLLEPFCLPEPERQALILLTALHDLGKINVSFRSMLLANQRQRSGRHWEVTEALLMHHDGRLAHLGQDRRRRWALYAATAGHHGRPPSKDQVGWLRMCRAAGDEAIADAGTLIDALAALWPEASLAHRDGDGIRALSWWLPGLVTAADWIGSNAVWFPPRSDCIELQDYLEQSRDRAATAVQKAGLEPASPSDRRLFDWPPRPMQEAAHEVPLPDGPVLAIIEDGTGSGKTEAALALAQRMLRAGKGRGLYVALPTMATADAMFARLRDAIGCMFDRSPSLTLAHGRASLSREFREFVAHDAQREDEPACTEWLADNRRRALLATVGVGTIDQALPAVLKARHSALRLFGLSSKILIVDEVHEVGEPYIVELLATLLRAHRQVGGSAILLTATLPTALRSRLIEAWGEAAPDSQAYPLLTVAGQTPRYVRTLADSRGPVAVRRLASMDEAVSILVDSAGRGAACVWVRNAVDDAIAGVGALRQAGIDANLLHARFALADRLRHQEEVLERFGKERRGGAGRVLVATQVVESSLDLDFDTMVSDLAPMAALIQRAGRLWRHLDRRPGSERPTSSPILHVLSPDPAGSAEEDWLQDVLNAGAWVYPLDLQWRTAQALFTAGCIGGSTNVRGLIESVTGEDFHELPPAIERAELERQGEAYARQNLAWQNRIDLDRHYRDGAADADDRHFPTRLGIEQGVLALARRKHDTVIPWARENGADEAMLWALSEVSVSAHRLRGLALPDQDDVTIKSVTGAWPEWRRKAVVVCPVSDDGTICDGLIYDEAEGVLFPSPESRDRTDSMGRRSTSRTRAAGDPRCL